MGDNKGQRGDINRKNKSLSNRLEHCNCKPLWQFKDARVRFVVVVCNDDESFIRCVILFPCSIMLRWVVFPMLFIEMALDPCKWFPRLIARARVYAQVFDLKRFVPANLMEWMWMIFRLLNSEAGKGSSFLTSSQRCSYINRCMNLLRRPCVIPRASAISCPSWCRRTNKASLLRPKGHSAVVINLR